ncbi:hypothetical protein [Sphingomonas solaris]|uniref:hypothetical protein n=1 Tax=Alterirhizorhabdus solaris TaxID=2529389 RepID=UPI00193A9992|nr:hypothetical protein [Sphingomonas solaris]
MPGPREWTVGDFTLRDGRIVLRKTGNSAAIDRRLIAEVATWLACHLAVRLFGTLRHAGRRRAAIRFLPDRPHPRYMVRAAAIWAGLRLVEDDATADAAFFFEDATVSPPAHSDCPRRLNFACTDISKSHVAAVFEATFGYPLAVDPATWRGPAVEKAEANGTHDGRIVECPRPPQPGRAYQRLIDTIDTDGHAIDLRTHCIGGMPVIVWIKRRAADARFLPPNLSAESRSPEEVFSPDERAAIARFCAAMGADWCGLDILRDRDGRIYVVDVNKTDAGPITALPFAQKLRAVALLARHLTALVAGDAPYSGRKSGTDR